MAYLIPSFLVVPIPKFTNLARTCSDDVTASARTHALPQLPQPTHLPKRTVWRKHHQLFRHCEPTWHPFAPASAAFRGITAPNGCSSACWLVSAHGCLVSASDQLFPCENSDLLHVPSFARPLPALRQTLRHVESTKHEHPAVS